MEEKDIDEFVARLKALSLAEREYLVPMLEEKLRKNGICNECGTDLPCWCGADD